MAEFPTAAEIFEPLENKSGVEANVAIRKWFDATFQLPGTKPTQTLAIVDDALTPTSADILVDTEGGAPVDNLQIIAINGTHDGMRLHLRAVSSARTVTVKHQPSVTYGITLRGGTDKILSPLSEMILKRDGNRWYEVQPDSASSMIPVDITGQTVDLNRFTYPNGYTEGVWFCQHSTGAANITPLPYAISFRLELQLLRRSSTSDFVQRMVLVCGESTAPIYERLCINGVWAAWAPQGAFPRPKMTAGVGQWTEGGGVGVVGLPSGGTWAYSLRLRSSADLFIGVAAGGTSVGPGGTDIVEGLIWRIA